MRQTRKETDDNFDIARVLLEKVLKEKKKFYLGLTLRETWGLIVWGWKEENQSKISSKFHGVTSFDAKKTRHRLTFLLQPSRM